MSTFTLVKVGNGGLTPSMYNQNVDETQWAIRALQDASSSSGTVSSVGLTAPDIFSVTNTPITSSGNIILSLVTQTQNKVLASPTSGNGTPTFRAIVLSDLPTITPIKGGNGLTSLGNPYQILRVNAGGNANEYFTLTGGSSKVSVTPSSGQITIDILEANLSLSNMGGVLPISKGGSGTNTAQAAIKALTQANSGTVGYFLTLDGAKNPVWSALPSINTSQIANNSVTYAKIQTVTPYRILGNLQAIEGQIEEIELGANFVFDGAIVRPRKTVISDVNANFGMTAGNGTIYADAIGGELTVTLPDINTVKVGDSFIVQRVNSGSNNVIVSVYSADVDVIIGSESATSKTLTGIGHTAEFQFCGMINDKNTWRVITEIK